MPSVRPRRVGTRAVSGRASEGPRATGERMSIVPMAGSSGKPSRRVKPGPPSTRSGRGDLRWLLGRVEGPFGQHEERDQADRRGQVARRDDPEDGALAEPENARAEGGAGDDADHPDDGPGERDGRPPETLKGEGDDHGDAEEGVYRADQAEVVGADRVDAGFVAEEPEPQGRAPADNQGRKREDGTHYFRLIGPV